jgi:hypothetical protein
MCCSQQLMAFYARCHITCPACQPQHLLHGANRPAGSAGAANSAQRDVVRWADREKAGMQS